MKEMSVEVFRNVSRFTFSKFEILQNGRTDEMIGNIVRWNERYYGEKRELMEILESINTSIRFSMFLFRIGSVGTVAWIAHSGGIAPFSLATLVSAVGMLDVGLSRFADNYKVFWREWVHIDKFEKLFAESPKIEGYSEGADFVFKKGNLTIDGVSFSYSAGKKPVFENFSLEIEGGKKTALVGTSGGGKTTLMKLLSGYVRPNAGSILADGQNLSEVSLRSYYAHIGYLTQDSAIFDGTVRENLEFSVESDGSDHGKKPERPSMEDALRFAECDFVFHFENGLDTEIGERGILLSGGQKQRLALAKIFYKNPEMVFLDEPTSALDSESEEAVTHAIHNLMEGRTIVIIAHRLQTVKECDRIVVVGNNGILEDGTHEELLAKNGTYARMVELQSGF